MTKEELEKEADNWLRKYLLCYNCKRKCTCIQLNAYCEEQVLKSYIASAEPREKQIVELEGQVTRAFEVLESKRKQIQIDAEQIRALQKQNGELTDKCNKLEAQIEKMKCWCNCKNYLSCLEECCRKNISFEKGICYNCKKWELRR